MRWGQKDVGLWINLMIPQRSAFRQTQPNSTIRRGACFAFNESQCKWLTNCKYKHECSHCGGSHSASKCFKKAAAQQNAAGREAISKSLDASEAGKNVTLSKNLPKQGNGSATN